MKQTSVEIYGYARVCVAARVISTPRKRGHLGLAGWRATTAGSGVVRHDRVPSPDAAERMFAALGNHPPGPPDLHSAG